MRIVKAYLFPVLLGLVVSSAALANSITDTTWPDCAKKGGCNKKTEGDACQTCCTTACAKASKADQTNCSSACPG